MVDDEAPAPQEDEPGPFRRGAPVVLRSVRDYGGSHGVAVGFAVAGTVVLDDAGIVVVSTTPGSGMRTRAGRGEGPNGRVVLPAAWDGTYDERVWAGHTVVRVHRRDDRWSVWRWHDGSRWTDTWYGNLESPWRRSRIGFDTQDWALDLVATGDPVGGPWSVAYKDQDELEWMVERGSVSTAQAAHVTRVGAELMERAKNARWPFDADWDRWRPDPSSPPVPLPDDWSRLASPAGRTCRPQL